VEISIRCLVHVFPHPGNDTKATGGRKVLAGAKLIEQFVGVLGWLSDLSKCSSVVAVTTLTLGVLNEILNNVIEETAIKP